METSNVRSNLKISRNELILPTPQKLLLNYDLSEEKVYSDNPSEIQEDESSQPGSRLGMSKFDLSHFSRNCNYSRQEKKTL